MCGLVLSNILMLRSFSKALQDSETTLQASVVNTASNFIFTVMTVFATYNQAFTLVPKRNPKKNNFFTILKLIFSVNFGNTLNSLNFSVLKI